MECRCDQRLGPAAELNPEDQEQQNAAVDAIVAEAKRRLGMHYRNGREAKNGDTIVQLDTFSGKIVALGVLHDATPGNDFCNGNIAPISTAKTGACMCDCLHLEDVQAILKEKGLDKRPSGK